MIIFNLIKDKRPNGKIAKFYNSYENLNWFGKAIWHIIFVNWIPMAVSVVFLLVCSILWNFIECGTLFYVSLGFVGVVFLPWIIWGILSIINDCRDDGIFY